jgi:hypothetical protein
MSFYQPSVSFDLELQNKISEIAGREKGKEIIGLLIRYGIKVITQVGGVHVQLPNLEIASLTPQGEIGVEKDHPARRHLFACKINGETLSMLQKVELDPFDYNDGEVFKAKLTIVPLVESKKEEPSQ